MKKLLSFVFAASVLAALTGCRTQSFGFSGNWSGTDLKGVTNLTQTAEIPAGLKNLELDNPTGAIHIMGTDSGPIRWTWILTVRAGTDTLAQQIAGGVRCEAALDGGRLKLVVSTPDTTELHSLQSDFEISVPKSAAVRAQTHFGMIEISDLAADVEAEDQNGRIEIRNIGGNVHARTSFSSLTVSGTGPAVLHNQNGQIEAIRIGGSLEAATSFASLHAQDIRGPAMLANQNGEIKAATIGGSLDATTSFASIDAQEIAGPVHLRDQNGRVQVVQAKGDADIKTSFARLSVEGIEGDAVLANQNGGVAASGVTGSVNADTSFAVMEVKGAGSKFVCHNQNGSIRLQATSPALRDIEAKTSFGTLEVHLPASLNPAVQARTTFADVESDFPVLMKPRGEDPFAGVASGTARIALQNQNGKISVVRD